MWRPCCWKTCACHTADQWPGDMMPRSYFMPNQCVPPPCPLTAPAHSCLNDTPAPQHSSEQPCRRCRSMPEAATYVEQDVEAFEDRQDTEPSVTLLPVPPQPPRPPISPPGPPPFYPGVQPRHPPPNPLQPPPLHPHAPWPPYAPPLPPWASAQAMLQESLAASFMRNQVPPSCATHGQLTLPQTNEFHIIWNRTVLCRP